MEKKEERAEDGDKADKSGPAPSATPVAAPTNALSRLAADEGERPTPDPMAWISEKSPTLSSVLKRIGSNGVRSLIKEFHDHMKVTNKPPGRTFQVFAANPRKNRYRDVECWDQTRVKLRGTSGNKGDYIHANWVDAPHKDNAYILTQGPMYKVPDHDETCADFWSMVWEQRVCVIIMLCTLVEQGKAKCAEYWPSKQGQTAIHGHFAILCKGREERFIKSDMIILTQLVLTPIGGQFTGSREVVHYMHTRWPDRKCPGNAEPLVSFLEKIHVVQELLTKKADIPAARSPLVVHCSAGIGRSGTLVAIDIAIQLLKASTEKDPPLDIPIIVRNIRLGRRFSVQTYIQYVSIYQTVIEFLRSNKRLPASFDYAKFNAEVLAFN